MNLRTFPNKIALGDAAAAQAAVAIQKAVVERGAARIIASTGASQFEFLDALVRTPGVPWEAVELFHLDEYAGMGPDHPASIRKYLRERLIGPTGIATAHLLEDSNYRAIAAKLASAPVDVAFVGIGENGHLAFNDPPADFETEEPYLIVQLDEQCRRQQVDEGWFASIDEVPRKAISVSIRQILKAREILCAVPDARKARAMKVCFEGPVSPMTPASILRTHNNTTVFLDADSAALLSPSLVASGIATA
ncbi:MAG TPA: 6-phosphogluconolactonase [Bryobacteraceae bacterium]|nr:6-phosphogluconolactonase [Bryobacteraceae bacterium]